jgi:hypothetical protein
MCKQILNVRDARVLSARATAFVAGAVRSSQCALSDIPKLARIAHKACLRARISVSNAVTLTHLLEIFE